MKTYRNSKEGKNSWNISFMLSFINQALTKKFIPNNYYAVYRMKKKMSRQKLIAAYKLNSHLCVFVFFFLNIHHSFLTNMSDQTFQFSETNQLIFVIYSALIECNLMNKLCIFSFQLAHFSYFV